MTQSTALRYPKGSQFFDSNGRPLALATLTYYITGTSTLQDTWSDTLGTVVNTNPIVLDGSGRTPVDIYLGSTGLSDYRETLRDSTGAIVSPWPTDGIPKATGTTGVSTDLSLTLHSGSADLNIVTGSGVTIPGATESLAGLMSASDKVKVDNLSGVYVACASAVTITNNIGTPSSKISVTTGPTMMTDGNGNGSFSLTAIGTIDLTISGAAGGNCLDTGALGSNTWYNIYQITNGTTVAFLASVNAFAPALPSGYTKFIRLGAMQTDGSNNLYRTLQKGRDARYIITGATNTASFPFSSSSSGSSFVSRQVTGNGFAAPPTAVKIAAAVFNTAAVASYLAPNNSYTGSTTLGNPSPFGIFGTSQTPWVEILLESSSVFHWGNGAGATAEFIGWTDQVNVLS